MQSFSAVAQTVGLDFEDAAAAMTLLRDVTQQSASTIGNSLKTIFARLSSLKMGETLEDGVDLTKYTKALESVGVEVLDANGDLRDMSDIIRSLAENWDNLDRAQKDALAQTVGGVRQYNNLITLMDHFEEFEELVAGAQESTGYLQGQADEYAESWEAAANRAKAAWQELYDAIIDDKFFIMLKDIEAGFASILATIVKSIGGMGGTISALGALLFSVFGDKLATSLKTIAYNFGYGREELKKMQEQAMNFQINDYVDYIDKDSQYAVNVEEYGEQLKAFNALKDRMTDGEREFYQAQLNTTRGMIEQTKVIQEQVQVLETKFRTEEAISRSRIEKNNVDNPEVSQNFGKNFEAFKNKTNQYYTSDLVKNAFSGTENIENINDKLEEFQRITNQLSNNDNFKKYFGDFKEILEDTEQSAEARVTAIEQKLNSINLDELNLQVDETKQTFIKIAQEAKLNDEQIQALITSYENYVLKTTDATSANMQFENQVKQTSVTLKEHRDAFDEVISGVQTASKIITGVNSASSLIKNITSGTIDFGQALLSIGSILMTLLPIIQKVITAIKAGSIASLGAGGIIGLVIGILYTLYTVLKTIGDYLDKEAYNKSTQKKIDDTTASLEKQKQVVSELASNYSKLESTIDSVTSSYDKLQKVAEEKGIGSPQYLLALEEYNAKLDELAEKYGDIFSGVNDNGVRILDSDKLASAQLKEFNTAKAYQQELENNLVRYTPQNEREKLLPYASAANASEPLMDEDGNALIMQNDGSYLKLAADTYKQI